MISISLLRLFNGICRVKSNGKWSYKVEQQGQNEESEVVIADSNGKVLHKESEKENDIDKREAFHYDDVIDYKKSIIFSERPFSNLTIKFLLSFFNSFFIIYYIIIMKCFSFINIIHDIDKREAFHYDDVIDYKKAIKKGQKEFDGEIREWSLAKDDGQLVYDMDLSKDQETHEITVDAKNGKVLQNETDN